MAALIEKLEQPTRVPPGDLKARLVEHFDLIKHPTDVVRITQVSPHHFRVNTLALKQDPDNVLTVYHITKSQFLHVEDRMGELVMTDQTRH